MADDLDKWMDTLREVLVLFRSKQRAVPRRSTMNGINLIRIALSLAIAAAFGLSGVGCGTSSSTGSSTPPPARSASADTATAPGAGQDQSQDDDELQMGQEVYNELKGKVEIIESSPLYDSLRPFAESITRAAQPQY